MPTVLFVTALRVVAAMPEPERAAYIRAQLLSHLDPHTETLMLAALPAASAAAARALLSHLRAWQ